MVETDGAERWPTLLLAAPACPAAESRIGFPQSRSTLGLSFLCHQHETTENPPIHLVELGSCGKCVKRQSSNWNLQTTGSSGLGMYMHVWPPLDPIVFSVLTCGLTFVRSRWVCRLILSRQSTNWWPSISVPFSTRDSIPRSSLPSVWAANLSSWEAWRLCCTKPSAPD